MRLNDTRVADTLNSLARICHKSSLEAGWWEPPSWLVEMFVRADVPEDQCRKWWRETQRPTKIALIHSEASEMLEGERKHIPDDHLPDRPMNEVEAADILIRLFDYCGEQKLDIGGALLAKFNYNQDRADHKPENRAKADGKRF